MKRIDPICEGECRPYYGKPVVLILKDGSEVSGVLSRVENGQLILNDFETAPGSQQLQLELQNAKSAKKTGKTARSRVSKKTAAAKPEAGRETAQTQAFPAAPYPYPAYGYYRPLIFDLTFILLLFALI